MADISGNYGNTSPDWGRSTDVFRNMDGTIDNSEVGESGTGKTRLTGEEKTSNAASLGITCGDGDTQRSAIEDRQDAISYQDIPQPAEDSGTVQDQFTVNDNMSTIMDKLRESEGSADVMFDIYAVLEMLQDSSQKLKNVMRQLRAAEVTLIQSNLMAQAQKQRENATTALIAGAVVMAVQLTVQIGSMVGMGKAMKTGGPKGEQAFQIFSAVNQLAASFGQYGQSVVQNVKSILDAKITEMQAQQKGFEEQLDQIKDTFASADETLKKAIEIYQAVTSKESQTIEGILRA